MFFYQVKRFHLFQVSVNLPPHTRRSPSTRTLAPPSPAWGTSSAKIDTGGTCARWVYTCTKANNSMKDLSVVGHNLLPWNSFKLLVQWLYVVHELYSSSWCSMFWTHAVSGTEWMSFISVQLLTESLSLSSRLLWDVWAPSWGVRSLWWWRRSAPGLPRVHK